MQICIEMSSYIQDSSDIQCSSYIHCSRVICKGVYCIMLYNAVHYWILMERDAECRRGMYIVHGFTLHESLYITVHCTVIYIDVQA